MRKVAERALRQLTSRLHDQAVEMATFRTKLDVQFQRIAHIQNELDQLPIAGETAADNAKAKRGRRDPAAPARHKPGVGRNDDRRETRRRWRQ